MTEEAITRPKPTLRIRLRRWLGLREPLSNQARTLAALEAMYWASDDQEPWLWVEPVQQQPDPNDSFRQIRLRVKGEPD